MAASLFRALGTIIICIVGSGDSMQLSAKHANQQSILQSDFTGGLNTSYFDSDIAANELSLCTNMEVDRDTGLLRTCKGLRKLCTVNVDVTNAAYDVLNRTFLLFTEDYHVYATTDFLRINDVGKLTGTEKVVTTLWESGVIIASGGKLQYYDGTSLKTLETSPEHCKGAYTRSGRVLTFDDGDQALYSGVGDATNWKQESNDPSTALFAQIGYKVGGKIIGAINLSADILFIKDNGMVFRLQNEYPDWKISELGRNIYCRSTTGFTNIGNNVIILGNNTLQSITTTQDYGDMKPLNIGQKISREINALPSDTKLRYVPAWNQLWFIGHTNYVLVMDCNTGGFFERTFSEPVVDIINADNKVYLIRKNAVCDFIDDFTDCGTPLHFLVKFKTNQSTQHILVKKVLLGITPYATSAADTRCQLNVGKLHYDFPRRTIGNAQPEASTKAGAQIVGSSLLRQDTAPVFMNDERVTPTGVMMFRTRALYRSSRIPVQIEGTGYAFILNYVGYDMATI